MGDAAPLIVTLGLAPQHQARFDQLRETHFPPERNFLAAHVTLFHHLPAPSADSICTTLADQAAAAAPFAIAVTALRSLGSGVAYALDSATLLQLRATLATQWWDQLTAQDRQGFRPHITIQNKVAPETARRLHARLSAEFTPFEIQATHLALWRYRGGPWDEAATFTFTGHPADQPERRHR